MSSNLTETDRQFLEKAIFCMKAPPELDINKMAEALGVKPKSVTNRWCEIKKKIYAELPAALAATPGRKRKAKVDVALPGGEGGTPVDGPSTPSKKPRARRAPPPKKKTAQEEVEEINQMIKKEEELENGPEAMDEIPFASADNGAGSDDDTFGVV